MRGLDTEVCGLPLIGLAHLAALQRGASCGRSPKMGAAGILARLTRIKQVPSVAGFLLRPADRRAAQDRFDRRRSMPGDRMHPDI